MCGILAVFSKTGDCIELPKKYNKKRMNSVRDLAYLQSSIQRHRGPDHTGISNLSPDHGVIMVQERLGIIGIETGDQPLISVDENVHLIANAEIYNYLSLSKKIAQNSKIDYIPKCDCDVLIGMYQLYGEKLLQEIVGMFAFVLYDKSTRNLLIARDPIGILPLYRGIDDKGNLWIASEMKSLINVCETIEIFQPGTASYGPITQLQTIEYYQPLWIKEIPKNRVNLNELKFVIESTVRTHLQCDVEFGALLSGGIDSSIIAAIASKILRERNPLNRLKTFSIGLKDAPDFEYSKMVAKHIGSDHREIYFTIEDGLDCIRDIIWYSETYDVTTIRSSIPMFLMTRAIKATGLKMILSGEGADEIFGGYLYFFNSPSSEEFHKELVNRMMAIHYTDCLRANKMSLAWGLELRVPFLDTKLIDYVMAIDPNDKIPLVAERNNGIGRIEKEILRQAFSNDNMLPDEIVWRQKEQFSDGVGYDWIQNIRQFTSVQISDEEFLNAQILYPINTPTTKEAYFYRSLFNEMFDGDRYADTVKRWIPRIDWGCSDDPSGRSQTIHMATNV